MNTTLLIKTFERPECPRRLIASARARYPQLPIIVIDDSREASPIEGVEYVHTEFDIGVSAGRNLGVSLVKTPYFFTCDDDNVFTSQTDLELAELILVMGDWMDVLGVMEEGNAYRGHYEVSDHGQTVTLVAGEPIEFVPNLFLMRTDAARAYPWDESLKMGEHFAYFFRHRGLLRVGFTSDVSLAHEPRGNDFYASYRGRATDYVRQFMRANGITKRIELDGSVLDA